MAERSSPQNRYRVEFPTDGSEPFVRLPLGRNWTSHPEAAAIGVELPGRQRSGNHQRAMTVVDCAEAAVVARQHRRGRDAHDNPVAAKVSDGAGRVLKKLRLCLEALVDAGVPGAADALRNAFGVASTSGSPTTPQQSPQSAGFDTAATSDVTAWVVRSGREGLETVESNLRDRMVSLGWGDWVFDQAIGEHGDQAALDRHFAEHLPRRSAKDKRNARNSILAFRNKIKTGDIVVMPLKGSRISTGWIAIGQVTGSTVCDPSRGLGERLRRPVQWLHTNVHDDNVEDDLRASINGRRTVHRVLAPNSVHRLVSLAEHGIDPGPDDPPQLALSGEEAGVLDVEGNVIEGASKRVSVLVYETDQRARRRCIAAHGSSCQVCGIDFGASYGDFADGFIHVHHKTPVHQAAADGEYELDPVNDLVPVCPNCHAMLHRHPDKPCSVEELQRLMEEAEARSV
ncbi:HNH endonuclease [Candidatus Poriferisodalis sp.]|uniref:HNH endonuclease n=1 Tax=Candidatus Poriferisodalis sp. TaxID=3101277 RepID=UPI003AF5CD2A